MVEVTQEDRGAVRAFHAKALGLAISGNEANRLLTEAFARHRIAAENAAQQEITALDAARGKAEPVAWLYEHPEGYYNTTTRRDDPSLPTYRGWIETPLYAHPPRGDQVARFVAHMKTLQPDEDVAECPATWGDFLQILEAEAEAWEPFNG